MKKTEHKSFVANEFNLKSVLFEQRNAMYGDNYLRFGKILLALMPNEIHLETESDMGRFAIYATIVAKLSRYAQNFERGGHDDSLDDLAVYAMMLKQLDVADRKKVRK